MKLKNILLFGVTMTSMLLAACGSTAPQMQLPPEKFQAATYNSATQSISNAKVDILFVVDNSGSMTHHQNTLVTNMDAFADRFFKNPRIDYKIGVVPMFDGNFQNGEHACGSQSRELVTDAYGITAPRNVRKMNPFGLLVPLKDPKDGSIMLNKDGKSIPPYITPETLNGKEVLKRTVRIGVQCGPEDGEFFSPVLGIIGKADIMDKHSMNPNISYAQLQQALNQKNQNFYDQDAYLVVIFITDADTLNSDIDPHEFYETLVAAKGGDRSKVLIISANPDLASHNANPSVCTMDGSTEPQKFPALLAESSGVRLDLCSSNFGKEMADVGDRLVERVSDQVKVLPFVPNIDVAYDQACTSAPSDDVAKTSGIVITYGASNSPLAQRQRICPGPDGYTIQPISNDMTKIILSANLRLDHVTGGQISITATPVDMRNLANGRTKKLN